MTISSTTRVAGPFTGNGSTATFPFTFKVFAAEDLAVVLLNIATGAATTLALTTDYTVALNDDQDSSPGGSITLTAGNLAVGSTLTLTTDIEELQGLDLTNAGGFYPDVINAALDRLTILVQQIATQAARALQLPLSDTTAAPELPPAAQRAGKLLMFDAAGNLTLVVPIGGAVSSVQAATGDVDGANKNFNFTALTADTPVPMVFAGGVFQTPGADYTVNSLGGGAWQLAFTAAPTQGPITVLAFA